MRIDESIFHPTGRQPGTMATEYIIYTDESESEGQYYSHFYGGALVRSTDLSVVESSLQNVKDGQNLYGEIKWSKVTATYLPKYVAVVDTLFDLVAQDKVKLRVMFTQNAFAPTSLTPYQRENAYFMLYYQFIKHAFGLRYSNPSGRPIALRLYLDRMPDTKEKVAQFRGYVLGLNRWAGFRNAQVSLRPDSIVEVNSHNHVVLQSLDIVLGAMHFRLNDKHKEKPESARQRGKRTIAKEKLYKHIRNRVCLLRPNFNIGASTGRDGDWTSLWRHPYRHWCFRPRGFEFHKERTKRG